MRSQVVVSIVSGLAGMLATVAIIAWARRTRPQVQGSVLVLRYPAILTVLGFLMGGGFAALAVRNAIYGSAVNSYAVALTVPLVLAVMGFYLGAETARGRVIVSDGGIQTRSLWRTREVRWDDITRVSHSPASSAYVLETRNAKPVQISSMLVGISALLDRLAEHGHTMDADHSAKP